MSQKALEELHKSLAKQLALLALFCDILRGVHKL